jgi:autotransporter-associated beta strand protein
MNKNMKNNTGFQTSLWCLAITGALCALAQQASAATVVKENNTDNLNLGSSWVGGIPPTSADIAQWDLTVTGSNTVVLGASTNWFGLKVADVGGPVSINDDGSILKLVGTSGAIIDLSSVATGGETNNNLTINCPLALSGSAETWNVATNRVLTINSTIAGNTNNVTMRNSGTFNLAGGSAATPSTMAFPTIRDFCTVNISGYFNTTWLSGSKFDILNGPIVNWTATGTINSGYGFYIGDGGTSTLNISNGTMTVMTGSHNGVGISGGGTGTLNIAGGSFIIGNNCNLYFGANYNNGGSGGYGVLTISSGLCDVGTSSSGMFEIGKGATGSGTINLNGGTLSTMRSIMSAGTAMNGTFNFNGGTLKAKGNQAALIAASVPVVNVRNGGAVIDDGGFAVGIAALLQHSTIGGDNTTDGGLTKNGAGLLTFSGALNHTYTGPTLLNAGEMMVSTLGSCSNSAVTVASGATNGVQKDVGGVQWSCAGLTYGTGNTYLDLNFLAAPGLSKAPVQVNGNLAINGTLNIMIRGTALWSVGTYPLINYTGTLSGTVPAAPFALPTGVVATIRNNTANKSIDLSVSVGNGTNPQIVTWRVGSETWDISTTPNWNNSDGNAVVFVNGVTAMFDDTATGPAPISVQLDTAVNPAGVVANNSAFDYTIFGSGSIGGTNSITKTGTNSLTLNTANTYSGGTYVNGGILAIAADNNLGSASAPLFINSGALSSTADTTMTRPITVNSNATISVTAGTTLSLNNGFTNPFLPVAFTTYKLALNGGGTLDLKGGAANIAYDKLFTVDDATLQISGGSFNDAGKMVLGTYANSYSTLNVNGGAFSVTGTNGGAWFVMSDNATASSTFNQTGGTVLFSNPTTNFSQQLLLGNKGAAILNVSGGIFEVSSNQYVFLGGHNQYATSVGNGTLNISGTGVVKLDSTAGFFVGSSQSGVSGVTGTINLQAGGTLTTARNIVSGSTAFGSVGNYSYLYLSGGTLQFATNIANFLKGFTQIAIDNNGAVIDDGGFVVSIPEPLTDNGGGFLTKNGAGTLYLDGGTTYNGATVVSAGALGGSGSIYGEVQVNTGGAIAAGSAGTNCGTFTIGGNLALNGGMHMRVNTSLAQSNDLVSVSGILTCSGTGSVVVSNVGPTLVVGEKFTLLNQPLPNGAALTVSGGGATWKNDLAVDGSITVLTVIPVVPPAATGVTLLPDRNISLTATGAVGTAWSLRATNNVAAKLPWPVISTGIATTNTFNVSDLNATNYQQRYYYFSAP